MAKLPPPNPESLKLTDKEPSLLFAIRELIRSDGINFEEWWDEFKLGFIGGKRDKETNFKPALWTKPKYSNLTPPDSKSGAMSIEYWPDKDKKKNSHLLSGTNGMIIKSIMDIMRENQVGDSAISGKGSKPLLRGFPCIKLVFASDDGAHYGVKQIRCVGYTENPKIALAQSNIQLLKEADINRWAQKIALEFGIDKEFGTTGGYTWRKGVNCLSYTGMIARLQGIEGYAYVRNSKDGEQLFTKMLNIFGAKPDAEGFSYSGKSFPNQFKTEEEVTVLGKKIKKPKRRPVVDLKFKEAFLYLGLTKKAIRIVQGDVALKLSI
jgi:hypothetical protein